MRTCRAVARGFTVAVAVANRDGIATPNRNANTDNRANDRANRSADDRAADRHTYRDVTPDPERTR